MPYSFLQVYGFFKNFRIEGIVTRDLRLIVLIREDLNVLPFADVITKAALSPQLFFKTLNVGSAGVELTTSHTTTRCSTN